MTELKTLGRQTADDIAFSLTHSPRAWSWRDASFDMLEGPGGIVIGLAYFTIYRPAQVRFGFWNRRRIRRAFRAWKRGTGNDLANQDRHRALLLIRRCLVELRAVA